jgi:hypothetical protein
MYPRISPALGHLAVDPRSALVGKRRLPVPRFPWPLPAAAERHVTRAREGRASCSDSRSYDARARGAWPSYDPRRRADDPRGAVVPDDRSSLGGGDRAGLPARGGGRARRRLGELRGRPESQPLVGPVRELLQRGAVRHSVERRDGLLRARSRHRLFRRCVRGLRSLSFCHLRFLSSRGAVALTRTGQGTTATVAALG